MCEHPRFIDRSHKKLPRIIYDWRHYLAVIQRKPGALRNGAPFAELPPAFRQLQDIMLRRPGGDREMVDILALVLHRLVDGKTIGGPDIDTPQVLILRLEPKANVERYDGLRTQTAGGRHAS